MREIETGFRNEEAHEAAIRLGEAIRARGPIVKIGRSGTVAKAAPTLPDFIDPSDPDEVEFWAKIQAERDAKQALYLDALVEEVEQLDKHHVGDRPVEWWARHLLKKPGH